MDRIEKQLKAYMDTHPFDHGDSDCKMVLDQLCQAYAELHESDPPKIRGRIRRAGNLPGGSTPG